MKNKILVVDDRATNRYIRSVTLHNAGYEIIEGMTGREALEKSIKEKPDLALLDVHLPDLTGLEVCRLLKNDPRTSTIMVLQISASAVEIEDAVTGLEGGADDYLIEPVEGALLVAKVRALLRLKAAEEKLRRSNERLLSFASAASHDLRTPLRAIVTFAQLLEKEARGQLSEEAREHLDSIIEGGKRMTSLVSDLLDYAKLTASDAEGYELVSVADLLQKVLLLNKGKIESTNAQVTYDALPQVLGSRVMLTHIVHNLVDNALKYARPHVAPEIHVGASFKDDAWVFCVRDNGLGFPNELAEDLFLPFRRFHKGDSPGNGLGLAICRASLEQYGGRIWAESQGEGATFYFTLPAVNVQASAQNP